MKMFFVFFILVTVHYSKAQIWNDLSYSPNQSGLEENPLKGFADIYGPENDFPRSINGKLFGLNQVMNGLNDFDWTVIDNFINQNKSEGNFSYLQVNIDPGPDQNNVPQSYMPTFLDGQYDFITVSGPVADLCPDWNDPDIIEAMLNFIDAFGERYDSLPEVFIVHLGLYGIYGEWQIGDAANVAPDFEMTQENKVLIANAFKQAFPNTYLLARYPEHMPDPELFGYSDGLFFTQSISTNTFFNHFYFDNTINLYSADQNWRTQVVGGEIDPCVQPTIWQNWPNDNTVNCDPANPSGQTVEVQNVVETIEAIRPTFLFSHHIFTEVDPLNTPQEWNNAVLAQKRMGYTLYIDQYRLSASNGFPVIEVNIQNKGVAPLYANWDIEFAAINTATNQFQSLGTQKWNLNIIQPDNPANYRSFIAPTTLADGAYIFLLRVVNPLETFSSAAKPLRFANDTQDNNGMEGWLTLGQITIDSGNAGIAPIAVTDIAITPSNTTLSVGNSLQINAVVSPDLATNQAITWVSSKPGTASVDTNGFVRAGPNYGTAKISAYTQDGGFIGLSEIIVEPKSVEIPALIEAEDYIRMNGVVPGFGKLGFIDDRDWIDYSVLVNASATFFIDIYASCPSCIDDQNQVQPVGYINIIDENENLLDIVRLPNTNSFDDFEIATSNLITLTTGTHKLRFEAELGNFDLDKIEFRQESILGTSSFEEQANSMVLFPNPTNDFVTIKINDRTLAQSPISVEIINAYGIPVKSLLLSNQTIELSHLAPGVYFLISDIDGKKAVNKMIKY